LLTVRKYGTKISYKLRDYSGNGPEAVIQKAPGYSAEEIRLKARDIVETDREMPITDFNFWHDETIKLNSYLET
jgi:hypothetical protein